MWIRAHCLNPHPCRLRCRRPWRHRYLHRLLRQTPPFPSLSPGTAGVRNSLTVTGAQRGSIVRFYYSRTNGTTTISSGVCRGKALSMRSPVSLGSAVADSTGKATLNVSLSRSLGGRTIYVQSRVESSSACKITNRVTQTIKRSSGGFGGCGGGGGGFFFPFSW